MRKEIAKDENGEGIIGSEFYNYRELAVKLAEYVKDMGYTHIEPVSYTHLHYQLLVHL